MTKIMDKKGFTMIEMVVVLVIVGIILALMVRQFSGSSTKANIEVAIKQMYGDLMEARARASAERKTYGLDWNSADWATPPSIPSTPASITGYELRVDTGNTGNIVTAGGYSVVRTVTLNNNITIINQEGFNSIPFAIKGSLDTATYGNLTATFYSECRACDHVTSGCDPEDPSSSGYALCLPSDTSPNCDNVDYPESSCIVVTLTRIKIGKWCSNACVLR
ncbi:MAG: prepilin-type N-terminal cleavage/methylation domain-containing protein [Nitrospirae bacterium]|nr:prepilin-type N-terminal cleavage/methylation domain-containing protein [Nitrospirota bacterium]MBF0590598.1 prepilin-type N-terminal cleavage/methylation domain-containing protein [Nitrospirota bacterium]